ncbi:MAG: type II toxin-antitoxin system VapC family toxin [Candidatus Bathyarchaeia archaeon]|nr:type II toxin-antitoxin system VapC family toxin [Thermoproteota archaeon]NLD66161.1 type II toxin-antitoxin system VapC family toxin [Thermoproteota archaeon]
MKYLFDSSAIFRAIKENKVEVLTGNCTLELARYELGNIVWKDYVLQAKISGQEMKMLAKTIRRTLSIMDVLAAVGSEEEILETAVQLNVTFYDASYVYFARTKNLQLISEDKHLTKKAISVITALALDDL